MRQTALVVFCGLFLLSWISGCDGQAAGKPKLVPVSGTVTRKGAPVEKAQVAFINPDASRNAIGETDSQGKFRLGTFGNADGAILGDHVVIVTKAAAVAAASPAGPPKPEDLAKMASAGQMTAVKSDQSIPAKYGDPKTTSLKATVKGDGQDDFTFDLVD